MAAKYRKIDPRIWRDERFIQLGPYEKLIAIYCLTAHSNRCGIFVFSPAMAEEEIGSLETFLERLGVTLPQGFRIPFMECFLRVVETLRWRWDKATRVVYLPTWWKYNEPDGENLFKGCLKDLHDLPQTPLLAEFYANIEYLPLNLIATLQGTLPQPLPETFANSGAGAGAGTGAGKEPAKSSPDVPPNPDLIDASQTQRHKSHGAVGEAVELWRTLWASKYQADYPYSKAKENKHLDWMLEQRGRNLDSLAEVFRRYLDCREEFFVNAKHPLGLLRQNFQKWIIADSAPGDKPSTARNGKKQTIEEAIKSERAKQNKPATAGTTTGSTS